MKTILIAPTYRCNADCAYCYTNSFKRNYPQDMGFVTFLDVTNRFIKGGGKTLKFIGGEPSIWKYISKAITYAKLRGLSVGVLSNGLRIIKAKPHTSYINISHLFDPSTKSQVEHTLDYYHKKNISIVFRYNIIFNNDSNELTELVQAAKKYNAFVDIVPAVPYSLTSDMGGKIYHSIEYLLEQGVRCNCSNPLMPCMFSPEQWEYLKKNIRVFSICSCGESLLVNPDGETVFPCTKVFLPKSINDVGKCFEKRKEAYHNDIEKLKSAVPESCEKCDYFLKDECFAGCYMTRVEQRPMPPHDLTR